MGQSVGFQYLYLAIRCRVVRDYAHIFTALSVILLHLYSLAVGMRLGVVASSGEARPVPTASGMNSRRPAPMAREL